MPIATYSNEYIQLDAGLSASTGGEHPNISQAQHRQRRLPVCASRLTAVEHSTTLRSTREAPARLASGAGDQRFAWQRGDTFSVPCWTRFEHAAADAQLFSMSDEPLMRFSRFYRFEAD